MSARKSLVNVIDTMADPMGAVITAGGFGICDATVLTDALVERGITDLEIITNNRRTDGIGLGNLLENKEFARQYLSGELEVEVTPQGTLRERLRAAGVGTAAFHTVEGIGTQVAKEGPPCRYARDGSVTIATPPKPIIEFDGTTYLREQSLPADFARVHA
jgi:3-oxoacid CoA-transferase subunit A